MLTDEETEAIAFSAAKHDTQTLADTIARYPMVWNRGDGEGGWVLHELLNLLEEHGIYRHAPLISRDRYAAIAARWGWACHYCDTPLGWGHESVTRAEIDHVFPASRGGGDAISNTVLACPSCNNTKSDRTPVEWAGEPCCPEHET